MGTSNNETESGQEYINEEANLGGTSIEAFFAASVIFITGATGFLGKALLEKLLRSCSRISTIYILIRPKKGLTLEERFESLMKNSVFDRIRWECPSAFRKVIAIKGDVSQPELGLSEEDRIMLTQTVNMIFHVAATVRFDEPLKVAVNLNTRGTQRLMELASNMLNLISFVHVSTAYSNADKKEVKEIIYKTAVKPETAIEMCENLNDETLNILEKLLRDKHPNTYTLTKGLAEDIIMRKMTDLPIAIVRPSIICAAYQEPFPGWVDNVFGITGILMEILRGTIRSIVCNDKLIVDVVPVDYVVDTLIAAAWHIGMRRNNNIQVYNCVSSAFNPIT
ncbi:hypothetical protein PV325_013218 [Microctonus aethiopoides]|uniref:Fatty acyl-CoA reductase n=1 Tax=Microctonus aethiopoides TaxID=144406 RepID=A0AA39KPL4_9HYME